MFKTAKGNRRQTVAPLAGAWIEIFNSRISSFKNSVAPLAGAWIEMIIIGALS